MIFLILVFCFLFFTVLFFTVFLLRVFGFCIGPFGLFNFIGPSVFLTFAVTFKKPFLYGESFCIRPFGLINFCSNF